MNTENTYFWYQCNVHKLIQLLTFELDSYVSWCLFISQLHIQALVKMQSSVLAIYTSTNKQVSMLETLYVSILKQTLVLTKSEYKFARLGFVLLGTNIKAMSAQLVGCCERW
jgi:hypothetical protein